jgi:hypothetical protein
MPLLGFPVFREALGRPSIHSSGPGATGWTGLPAGDTADTDNEPEGTDR